MISRKLWRALYKPPRQHPLFQYILSDSRWEEPRVTSGFVIWMFMLAAIIFIWSMLFQPILWTILALFVSLNSIYSIRWVLRIAHTIAQEKEAGRYDLLASLPVGLLGTSWALTTGALHRRSSFRWLPYLILMTVLISFISLCGFTTLMLSIIEQISDREASVLANLEVARMGITVLPFLVLFYFDHVYSILTAIVFGQVVAIDVKSSTEGKIRAFLGFLVIQLLTYVVSLGFAILILPALIRASGFTEVSHLIMIGFTGVIVFIMLRELIVFVLWRYLINSLEADNKEVALILKPFYEAESILRESEQARVRHMDTTGYDSRH